MNDDSTLPVGKLPAPMLEALLSTFDQSDTRVIQGPGTGLDCAVIQVGDQLLAFKSDPITFASDEIGWYSVQVNANDLATCGATPRWFLMTLLLPESSTTPGLARQIVEQVETACRHIGVTVVGGHTEVTYGLKRPILSGTMVGEIEGDLVTPRGASPGDRLLLTKGVPIEGTAILARELPDRLAAHFTPGEIEMAQHYLIDPGISVLKDAQIAMRAGGVTAMHDPTEGGLAGALWELADASGRRLVVDPQQVPVPALARRVCEAIGLNPLATIASGALLLAARPDYTARIRDALTDEGINVAEIGHVEGEGPGVIMPDGSAWLRPDRDEIGKAFETT
jgi:hydrogenase maturation factor